MVSMVMMFFSLSGAYGIQVFDRFDVRLGFRLVDKDSQRLEELKNRHAVKDSMQCKKLVVVELANL